MKVALILKTGMFLLPLSLYAHFNKLPEESNDKLSFETVCFNKKSPVRSAYPKAKTTVKETKKFLGNPALERLKMILNYYYTDSISENLFNKNFKLSELKQILASLAPYRKYYVAELELLGRCIHKNSAQKKKMPLTDFLIDYEQALTKAVNYGKLLGMPLQKKDSVVIGEIFRGRAFTEKLSKEQKEKLFTQALREKINNGDLLITDNQYRELRSNLKPASNFDHRLLNQKYSTCVRSFLSTIYSNYLNSGTPPQVNFKTEDITALEGNEPGIYAHRFSYGFVYEFVYRQLIQNKIGIYLSKSILKDAFQQLAMGSYAELVSGKRESGVSGSGIGYDNIFARDSSEVSKKDSGPVFNPSLPGQLKYIGALYKSGQVKYVSITKRKYFLSSKTVKEKGFVRLKNGRKINYEFQCQIPFNLINRVRYNQKYFRMLDYSFLSRTLRLKYSPNSPFFEFLDIIENYPIECMTYLHNGLQSRQPVDLTVNQIRLNVSSGHPGHLIGEVGLKIGYQKEVRPVGVSIGEVFTQIKQTNDISSEADSLISVVPGKIKFAGYNQVTYESFNDYDKFQVYLSRLYGVGAQKEAEIILYRTQQSRAIGLPEKRDCNGCYDVLYCNVENNKALNKARANAIVSTQREIGTRMDILDRFRNTNLLTAWSGHDFIPLGSVYVKEKKEFINLFQISAGGKGCLYAIKFDKSVDRTVDQIIKINEYLKKTDPYFLERYRVDFANLSSHGYEYLIRLFALFQRENYGKDSFIDNLLEEGYINLDFEASSFDIGLVNDVNPFTSQLFLSHFIFREERDLISEINSVPVLNANGLDFRKKNIEDIDQSIAQAIRPNLNEINANFNKAEETWNEFSIFVGVSGNNGGLLPIIAYSGGSLRVTLAMTNVAYLPVLPIPNVKMPKMNPTTLNN